MTLDPRAQEEGMVYLVRMEDLDKEVPWDNLERLEQLGQLEPLVHQELLENKDQRVHQARGDPQD